MRQSAFLGKVPGRTTFTFALFAALALLIGGAKKAEADIYLFSYSDSLGDVASGTLSATNLGGGSFWATSGTLTVTGPAAGTYSLVPGGPATFGIPGFIVNNVIYPSADPVLDVYGLGFVSGTTYLNIWGNSPGNYSFYTYDINTGYGVVYTGNAFGMLTAIPEPATFTILGLGVFVCSLAAVRRRKQAV